jgi:hypothetical protein
MPSCVVPRGLGSVLGECTRILVLIYLVLLVYVLSCCSLAVVVTILIDSFHPSTHVFHVSSQCSNVLDLSHGSPFVMFCDLMSVFYSISNYFLQLCFSERL